MGCATVDDTPNTADVVGLDSQAASEADGDGTPNTTDVVEEAALEVDESQPADVDEPAATTTQAIVTIAPAAVPTKPATTTTVTIISLAVTQFNQLVVSEEEVRIGYSRDLFGPWIDADGDGCDTRREVLIAEALVPPKVGSRCLLSGGEWSSRYDGIGETGSGSGFDVDHLVPLAEAWDSGASSWNPARRRDFANDLGYEHSLIAVSASSNRSKSARDPAEWMPAEDQCWYVAAWIAVKLRWGLTVDRVEHSYLQERLTRCGDSANAEAPTRLPAPTPTPTTTPPTPSPAPTTPTTTALEVSTADCHPDYEPCIPNLPGDALNCGDLNSNQKPVTVLKIGVDPYRLDRDNNGAGCTS